MNLKLKYFFIIFLILLFAIQVQADAPDVYLPIVTTDQSLSATVFATDGTTTMDAELIDGRLYVSDYVHGVKNLRVHNSVIHRLKNYNGKEVLLYHVNDAGVKDSSRLVPIQSDGTWTYFYDVEFSEVIIDGFVGTYEVTAYNLSVLDSLNFGQTFNASNVTSLLVNVTDYATKSHPYDINTTNLTHWYPFDDDDNDYSGNGNNATAYGTNLTYDIGKYNNGRIFDGTNNNYIDLLGIPTINEITFAVTINAYSINPSSDSPEYGLRYIFSAGSSSIDMPNIPTIRARMYNGTTSTEISTSIDLLKMYRILITINNGTLYLYINGELKESTIFIGDFIGSSDVHLGNYWYLNNRQWDGLLDNVLIYERGFNQSDVDMDYYDHLQQLKIKTNSNSTWSSEWNSTANNPIQVPYTDGELFSLLNFTVPDTVVQNGITIYDYPSTVQFDAVATVGYTEDITKITEEAAAGTYTLNVTHAANNTGEGYINYTTANTILLDADFWNAATLTTDNPNASLSTTLPHFNISTGYVAAATEYYYLIEQDYFYPPQNLASITDVDQIHFDWDDYNNIDHWNISQLDVTIPFTFAYAVLDGIKDACYTCCCAYGFVGDSPNPYTDYGKETIYILRNDTYLILYADGEDNDGLSQDDEFAVGIDASNNNLTTDDRKFILGEGGTVTAKRWSGSSWLPQATNAQGVVVGAGTPGAIQYEMFIPVSELDTNFTNGSTVKFFMSRTHTASNPDVESYYPQTLQNDTDATLWQSVLLSETPQYTYIDNTSTSDYTVTGLDPFTWYQHQFTAINGTQETTGTNSADITLDTPSYTISGYIKDISGNPIANADVWGENGYPLEHNVSNASGYYIGIHFHNGTYTIYANATNTVQNSILATVSGANLTNQNITLNYYNFSYTGISATSPIKDGETSTVLVDVTDYDGTIQAVKVKIEGINYTMQNIAGNTWRYFYSDTSIVKKHYITNIYAQDNTTAWNSTTSSMYIDVVAAAGEGNSGGFPPITLPGLPEVLPEIPLPTVEELVPIITNLTESINETIHLVGDIISADGISMLKLNTDVGEVKFVKEIERVGAIDCSSSDPMVQCGVLNDKVIVIVIPELKGSIYNRMDSHVSIEFEDGTLEYTKFTIIVLDAMGYLVINPFFYDNPNPYLFEVEPPSDAVIGVRYWWPTSFGLLGMFVGRRYYGK